MSQDIHTVGIERARTLEQCACNCQLNWRNLSYQLYRAVSKMSKQNESARRNTSMKNVTGVSSFHTDCDSGEMKGLINPCTEETRGLINTKG